MCGIAGILYKGSNADQDVGEALISMLDGCQHRGPDSTGFALYHEPKDDQLRLRFFVGAGNEATAAISEIKEKLQEFQAEVLGEESVGTTYKVIVKFSGDVQRFAYRQSFNDFGDVKRFTIIFFQIVQRCSHIVEPFSIVQRFRTPPNGSYR